MNVLEMEVQNGIARIGEIEFPAHEIPHGRQIRVGFRPYAVQVSGDPEEFRYRATLRHTFFLGIMLRLEFELPSGLTIRARMTKEDYAHKNLADGAEVSFQIRNYRILSGEDQLLQHEPPPRTDPPPAIAEGI